MEECYINSNVSSPEALCILGGSLKPNQLDLTEVPRPQPMAGACWVLKELARLDEDGRHLQLWPEIPVISQL